MRFAPVREEERIQELDLLRGLAILAILVANIVPFSTPVYAEVAQIELWTSPLDRAVAGAVDLLVVGKLYPLFAFLLGVGAAVQFERARRAGEPFTGRYARRMALLLVFGAAHVLLLWYGDVLALYALLGVPLLLFLGRSSRTLLISAIAFLLLPVVLSLGLVLRTDPSAGVDRWEDLQSGLQPLVERSIEVYSAGSFTEIVAQRLRDFLFLNSYGLMAFPTIFAMVLFGVYAARVGLFQASEEHARTWRALFWGGLIVGLGGNAVLLWGAALMPVEGELRIFVVATLRFITLPAHSCFYLAAGRAVAGRARGATSLAPVVAVGRTSLSNYLLQSLICTSLLYSYGVGLYGRVGPALGLGATLLILPAQVLLSRWWMQRYRFGPVEWLWRSGTYGSWQPLTR